MSWNLVPRPPWGKGSLLLVAIFSNEDEIQWRLIEILSILNLFILIDDQVALKLNSYSISILVSQSETWSQLKIRFHFHLTQYSIGIENYTKLKIKQFQSIFNEKIEIAVRYTDSTGNHFFQYNSISYIKQRQWHWVTCTLHLFVK